MKKLIPFFLSILIVTLTGFSEINDSLSIDKKIKLTLTSSDKQVIQTAGIQNQELLIKVRTKERERKTDTITEIWITAWSTYNGKTVKTKFHRFIEESKKYDEPLIFRHYDKRDGVTEIKINFLINLQN